MALTEEDVLTALRDVNDPELPVNIVDLGLIYKGDVLPDPDAPGMLPKQKVAIEITVDLVWEPAWTPDRISPEAQKKLGIAAF